MIKLIGGKRLNTAVFISGKGSNLKNLIKFSLKKNSPIKIRFVVSNNKKAKGLNFSKKYKIESRIFTYSNKQITENQILKHLKKREIKLICLAGFMKILSKNFIRNFQGKILNIHPSILPLFCCSTRSIPDAELFELEAPMLPLYRNASDIFTIPFEILNDHSTGVMSRP